VRAERNGCTILDSFGLQEGRVVRWLQNLRAGTSVIKFSKGA